MTIKPTGEMRLAFHDAEGARVGCECPVCLNHRLAAVFALIERDYGLDDQRHIIDFRTDGWTIKHPMACRPALFDCPVNRVAQASLTEAPAIGRFECDVNDLGDRLLILDRVEEPTS